MLAERRFNDAPPRRSNPGATNIRHILKVMIA
jgi:hypothetical protein